MGWVPSTRASQEVHDGVARQQIDEALAFLGVQSIDELDASYLELPPSWASARVSSA
ncbi:MAG: hypothetical protein ACRDNI_10260 [Gaiellaceae bacterium]